MAIDTVTRRRKRLSMTSLIDVIFLLLLFFMLTSTFSKYGEIELSAAGQGSSSGASDVRPHFLSLTAGGMLLNGLPVQPEDLPDTLASASEDAEKLVLISLSGQTTSQTLVETLVALRGISGVRSVVLQ